MTTYARREVVSTRIEYGVAAGQDIGTVLKVMQIAYADWRQREGWDEARGMPDDWARAEITDDEIVFSFVVDVRTEGGAR